MTASAVCAEPNLSLIFDGWLYAATMLYNKKKVERIQAFVAMMNKTLFAWDVTSK